VEPESKACVTIFFSDIVGYTELGGRMEPHLVMNMLDRYIYTHTHICVYICTYIYIHTYIHITYGAASGDEYAGQAVHKVRRAE
jgi:hypothetical protein